MSGEFELDKVCPECGDPFEECSCEQFDHDADDMDGDHASALASAGFGTDEDYGYYPSDFDDYDPADNDYDF